MENAAPTSRGYFLGDYQGLAAAGTSFYTLFGQAGSGAADPSNIWFRDPPPAAESPAASAALPPGGLAVHALPAWGIDVLAANAPGSTDSGLAHGSEQSTGDQLPPILDNVGSRTMPTAQSADIPLSGGSHGSDWAVDGEAMLDVIFSNPWDEL
jgi:hypothetical protein